MDIDNIFLQGHISVDDKSKVEAENKDRVISVEDLNKYNPQSNSFADIVFNATNQGYQDILGESKDLDKLYKYGVAPNSLGDNYDKLLADAQSNWSKGFNMLGQTLASEIVLGTAIGFADLFDFTVGGIIRTITGEENDYINPVSEFLQKGQNYLNEKAMPIYVDPEVNIQNGGLVDMGWWFKNLPQVASSLTLLFPARAVTAGLGKIGQLIKIGKGISKARKWASNVSKIEDAANLNKLQVAINNPLNIAKVNKGLETISDAMLMRTMENYQESRDTYAQTYQNALDKLTSMSDEDYSNFIESNPEVVNDIKDENGDVNKDKLAKHIAKMSADRTFSMDFSNVIFDVLQLHGLKNIGKGVKKATGRLVNESQKNSIRAAEEFATGVAKETVKKPFYKKGFDFIKDVAKYNGKTILEESTEGIEEAVNYIAQQEGLTYGKMLLEGNADDYNPKWYKPNAILTWWHLQGNLNDYVSTAELQESAFWGVMGGWFFGVGGNVLNRTQLAFERKAAQNRRKENPITGEKVEDKQGWFDLFELPELKAARLAISKRQARLEQVASDLKQIEEGIDIFAKPDEAGNHPHFQGDVETQQALARQQIEANFISEITQDALNSGTYDLLFEYFKSDAVKKALVKAGISTESEINNYSENIIRQIEHTKDLYARHSAHVLNQVSALNASKKIDETIPLEYVQIIANQNVNKILNIENIDKQIAKVEILAGEQERIEQELNKDTIFPGAKEAVKLGSLIDMYSRLSAEMREIDKIEKEEGVSYKTVSAKQQNKAQQDAILNEIKKTTLNGNNVSFSALFNALKYGNAYKSLGNGKFEIDEKAFKRNDAEILSEMKSTFKDLFNDELFLSDESIIQTANKLREDIEKVTGKQGLANANQKLFEQYATLSQLNLQKNIWLSQVANTQTQIQAQIDFLHNTMNEARKKMIDKAHKVIENALEQYGNEENNYGDNIIDTIFKLYSQDKESARKLAEEFMSNDETGDNVTAAQFMDALDIFNFTNKTNDILYKTLEYTVNDYKRRKTQGRSQDTESPSIEIEETEDKIEESNVKTPENVNNKKPIEKPRKASKIKIGFNSKGQVSYIKNNNNDFNTVAYENSDGTFELDIQNVSKNNQLRYAIAGLLDSNVDILNENIEWEVVQNPILKKDKKGYKIVQRGIIDSKENAQSSSPVEENETKQQENQPIPEPSQESKEESKNEDKEENKKSNVRKGIDVTSINTTPEAKEVIRKINAAQEKVDRSKTDEESYYIEEKDGLLHAYDRMHKRMGSNFVIDSYKQSKIDEVNKRIKEAIDDKDKWKTLLDTLEREYLVTLDEYKNDNSKESFRAVSTVIKDAILGINSKRALDSGTAVDEIIRAFFNDETPVKPKNLSDLAFNTLIEKLKEIKTTINNRGETFLTNNLVLYFKYQNGERVAGEVDILSVDKNGVFRIYDVKTSAYPFHAFEFQEKQVNFFEDTEYNEETEEWVSTLDTSKRVMSTKDYYTLQLSGYRNLFANQFGEIAEALGIVPFRLTYVGDNVVNINKEDNIPITYNPNVNVPIEDENIKQRMLNADNSSTGEQDNQDKELSEEDEEDWITERPYVKKNGEQDKIPVTVNGISASKITNTSGDNILVLEEDAYTTDGKLVEKGRLFPLNKKPTSHDDIGSFDNYVDFIKSLRKKDNQNTPNWENIRVYYDYATRKSNDVSVTINGFKAYITANKYNNRILVLEEDVYYETKYVKATIPKGTRFMLDGQAVIDARAQATSLTNDQFDNNFNIFDFINNLKPKENKNDSTLENNKKSAIQTISNEEKENIKRGVAQIFGKYIPNLQASDINFDDITNKVKEELKEKAKLVGITEEELNSIIDEYRNELQSAREKVLALQSKLAQNGLNLAFAAKYEEPSDVDFSLPFQKAIESFMEEYKKIIIVPEVDGRQVVRIGDILRICNNVYGTSDNRIAKSMYQVIVNYLNSPIGEAKYLVIDKNIGEKVIDNVTKTPEQIQNEENDDLEPFKVNIASFIEAAEQSLESIRDEYFKALDSLNAGDKLDMYVTDEEIIFKKGNVTIGNMPKPYIKNNYLGQINKGWRTEITIDAHGNPISKSKDIIEDIFTGTTQAHIDIRKLLVKIQDLDNNNWNDKDYEDKRKALFDAISKNPIIQFLANQSKGDRNNDTNIFFVDDNNGSIPFEQICEYLYKLWNYSTLTLSASSVNEDNRIIRRNLDRWFNKLYETYNAFYNIQEVNTVEIQNINHGKIIWATKNFANYYEMPLVKNALAKDTDARLSIVDDYDSSTVNVSGRNVESVDRFSSNSTLLTVYSRNTQPDFIKAVGIILSDPEAEKDDILYIRNAAGFALKDAFQEMINMKAFSNTKKVEELIRNIIVIGNDTSRIPLFRTPKEKSRFIIKDISKPGTSQKGITISWTDGVQSRRFRIYSTAPNGGSFGYLDDAHRDKRQFLYSGNKNNIAQDAAIAFMQFIKDTCNVNISKIGIKADNIPNNSLTGFIKYKDGKLVVDIPSTSNHSYHKEFDSYNDFLIKGNLLRVNTKIGKNGTNFERLGKNQRANQILYVYLPKKSNQQAQTTTSTEYVEDSSDKTTFDEVKSIINTNKTNVGLSIYEKILGKDAFEQFKEIATEYDILNDILPTRIFYDPLYNTYKNGKIVGNIAESSGLKDRYRSYRQQGNFLKDKNGNVVKDENGNPILAKRNIPSNENLVLGIKWLNMASSMNIYRRREAVRKLIHEQLHIKLHQDEVNRFNILKALDEVFQEYEKNLEQDLKTFNKKSNEHEILEKLKKLTSLYDGERKIEEFLVESLTNEVLFNYLNSIYVEDAKDNNKKDNLFTKIAKLIAKIFGWDIKDESLYMKQLNILRDILSGDINEKVEKDVVDETKEKPIEPIKPVEPTIAEEESNKDKGKTSEKEKPDEDEETFDLSNYEFEDEDEDENEDNKSFPSAIEELDIDENGFRRVDNFLAFRNRLPIHLQDKYDTFRERGLIETKCQ